MKRNLLSLIKLIKNICKCLNALCRNQTYSFWMSNAPLWGIYLQMTSAIENVTSAWYSADVYLWTKLEESKLVSGSPYVFLWIPHKGKTRLRFPKVYANFHHLGGLRNATCIWPWCQRDCTKYIIESLSHHRLLPFFF